MINESFAKKCCCEDISLIENYQQAVNDKTQMWECHHRLGIKLSAAELKARGLYYNRPAAELIFLTKSDHKSLHNKGENNPMYGKHPSAETRAKIGVKSKGRKHTEESIEKIRKASTGRHHTEEAKAKIGAGNKGKHLTEEAKAKIGASNRGKHRSEETRAKLSEARTGGKNSSAKPVYQIDEKTGALIKRWDYIKEAADTLNIARHLIRQCCQGKRKSAGGYVWKYATDLEKVI